MKILNLYAGIGGNRKLWKDHQITAIELDREIARAYKDFYPEDEVVVTDAHQYLLDHYKEFDFIWSSPPCPTHGQYRYNVGYLAKGYKAVYPDMKLYEEIIFLKYYFKGGWIVENTISYYQPLVEPVKIGRHYVWSNFEILPFEAKTAHLRTKNKISDFEVDLSGYKIENKRQVLRNQVDSLLGKHILDCFELLPLNAIVNGKYKQEELDL